MQATVGFSNESNFMIKCSRKVNLGGTVADYLHCFVDKYDCAHKYVLTILLTTINWLSVNYILSYQPHNNILYTFIFIIFGRVLVNIYWK